MRITDSAVQAILQVMLKKGLNPKTTFFEVGVFEGNLGIGFAPQQEAKGKMKRFGPLGVVVANNVDATGVVVDFGEVNGRKGLIFLGEEHVRNNEHTRNDSHAASGATAAQADRAGDSGS